MSADIKSRIRRKIQEEEIAFSSNTGLTGLYIFFSYDLVNSTRYKEINKDGWPKVITHFYSVIKDSFRKRSSFFQDIKIWKYAGDEVLLYHKLKSREEIKYCLQDASNVLDASIQGLHTAHKDTKSILSIKASVWCAYATYLEPQTLDAAGNCNLRNIILLDPNGESTQLDFLGPDVDVGFRISHYTHRRRLVLSADLAYLLCKNCSAPESKSIEDSLKIITFKKLKGIWNGRMYPIIWFEKDWNKAKESIFYDEHFESDLIKSIHDEKTEEISILYKVYKDLDKSEYIEALLETLPGMSGESDGAEDTVLALPDTQIEVHCVAVCFNKAGKILIAKRPESKNIYPDRWEFGCGQLGTSDTFESCLSRSYREDFNATLSFGENLIPIKTYTISARKRHNIPGIIFLAQIEDASSVVANKHNEIKWIDPQRVQMEFTPETCVPDFLTTVDLAFERWKIAFPGASTM
ncbi:MAG: hypothetical protein AB7D07_15615 [Desulfovibrionaceae bacterium]